MHLMLVICFLKIFIIMLTSGPLLFGDIIRYPEYPLPYYPLTYHIVILSSDNIL